MRSRFRRLAPCHFATYFRRAPSRKAAPCHRLLSQLSFVICHNSLSATYKSSKSTLRQQTCSAPPCTSKFRPSCRCLRMLTTFRLGTPVSCVSRTSSTTLRWHVAFSRFCDADRDPEQVRYEM